MSLTGWITVGLYQIFEDFNFSPLVLQIFHQHVVSACAPVRALLERHSSFAHWLTAAAPKSIPDTLGLKLPGWRDKQCTERAITDAGTDPKERWNAVDSSTAFSDANKDWASRKGPNYLSYSQHISNFFHGRDGMLCQDVQKTNCDATSLCSDVSRPAGLVSSGAMAR